MVLRTHQLCGCPSLQKELNGQSVFFVQTFWQLGAEPVPSSMHALPCAHSEAPHFTVEDDGDDEQPMAAKSKKAVIGGLGVIGGRGGHVRYRAKMTLRAAMGPPRSA
jgi:hypothetical protein